MCHLVYLLLHLNDLIKNLIKITLKPNYQWLLSMALHLNCDKKDAVYLTINDVNIKLQQRSLIPDARAHHEV